MRKTLALFAVMVFAAVVLASCGPDTEDNNKKPEVPENGKLIEQDGWYLVLTYNNIGTRSEGQHGDLYKGDKLIEGEKGDVKDTPMGKMKHYGDEKERLWDTTGWNYEDKSKFTNFKGEHIYPGGED